MQKCRQPSCLKVSPLFSTVLYIWELMSVLKWTWKNIFPVTIRATGTCTCRVSAVAVKLITFQSFDKFQDAFWGIIGIIAATAEALCAERQLNVARISVMSSAFNFRLGDGDIGIEKIVTFYIMSTLVFCWIVWKP